MVTFAWAFVSRLNAAITPIPPPPTIKTFEGEAMTAEKAAKSKKVLK